MLVVASDTAAWIEALSTLGVGVVGAVFTFGQWWASGFHPRCLAEVEDGRRAIRVRITNRGRGTGVIDRVVVVVADEDMSGVDWADPEHHPSFSLPPTRLPGLDQIELIILAPPGEIFHHNYRVLVEWGWKKAIQKLKPVEVRFVGLNSLIPPQ